MKKTLQIANGIAVVATIVINYLSNTGIFNGYTVRNVSDKYHNYFSPAGYAFSIWGLIYLGLLGFVFDAGSSLFKKNQDVDDLDNDMVLKIGWWFVMSCVGNSFWIIAWLYGYIGISVILMFLILFSLLIIIIKTRMELDFHPVKKYLFVFWPFAIYAGWISVAFIADMAAWLTKIRWNGWGVSQIHWTIIMIIIAGFINVLIVWKRNLREYALVGIWALVAIAISNQGKAQSIVYACYVVSAIILISILISGFKNHKSSFKSM